MEIDEQQLDEIVKELFPIGYTRFYRNRGTLSDPRLVKGVELLNTRKEWAISLFRNVHNEANDVEIAIAPARIVPDGLAGAALNWLETVRGELDHREHTPHYGSYEGDVFRIGLKLPQAQVFLRRFMAEVLKRPSQAPWASAGAAVADEPTAPLPTLPSPANERARSIAHMVRMAFAARDQSGLEQTTIAKEKKVRFASAEQLQAHLEVLWTSEHCVLSGVKLNVGGDDPDFAPSLDRIDSSKHYEPGNLQVVARFINRWKSDDDQENFARLLRLVKAAPTEAARPKP
ncbi:hypothetical protein [Variovorax sp. 770b2]|uniref:hypothetical protein n=1 Tax=Variovorax sp. 770b2 TaxID=1566271 RepID=UPI0008F397ED|nr:hypothetical protein [Variovorax sp. 770b2]SFQ40726.1 hypothetical protein SAMN03159339_0350 [Variovorax sp. 770b2]